MSPNTLTHPPSNRYPAKVSNRGTSSYLTASRCDCGVPAADDAWNARVSRKGALTNAQARDQRCGARYTEYVDLITTEVLEWKERGEAKTRQIAGVAPPHYFSLNTQYDLRAPVGLKNAASQASPDFGGQVFEDTPSVPSIVITHGTMGNQTIVMVVEIQPSLTITRAESDKFKGYARTVEAMGPPGAHATMLLIAGGFAFEWRRDQFADLHRMDVITPEYLAGRASIPVNFR
ncbi:hypothetical protein FRC10_006489 [Ceratobasidium sp. 414]|nr:hypothetical protein FRC10_006489 [Ceratobasidium sp. 414]